MNICILGAGISGLAAARLLAEDGHDVTVLEPSPHIAGLCRSETVEGFTFDLAGGHILFSKNTAVMDWMKGMAGGEPALVQKHRNTRILWHDRYVPYPFENGVGHLTTEARFECLSGYVKSYVDRKLGKGPPPNFHDWIVWKMGEGFAKHFMFPYNQKIWECDLRNMSSAWVEGRVPDAPIDDILKAAIGVDTQGYVHQAVFWFPKQGGFQRISEGVYAGIRARVKLKTPVTSVRKTGSRWRVNDQDFDLVINTAPLPEVHTCIEGIPDAIRRDIAALVPISLVNVLFGVKADQPLEDLSWVYLPFADQGAANRVTFFSNYSPHNAPPGHVSFMAEATFRGTLDVTSAWLDDLERAMVKNRFFPKGARVVRHFSKSRYAYIDQDLEFAARIARVRAWFDQSGMITFGRFGRYEYHNSDQCVIRAFEVRDMVRAASRSGAPVAVKFG